ncbi:TetR/AcrR family transcriptional regulator [Streptomyces sp. NPDC005065]|uniref:TetR/AcrR family transcriptional regulator n=1 Tax=Streptomyces sp. NPDC005065 TaxID=3154461 RepID=UPI0033BB3FCF
MTTRGTATPSPSTNTPPLVGRPRGFDADRALERAMLLFWRHGYEGATLTGLTTAMGISRTSMYAAYGNKRQLFALALARYADTVMAYAGRALAAPAAREVAETFLRENVRVVTARDRPLGCFSLQGGLACGPDNTAVSTTLARSRQAGERAMRDRFRRAADEGDSVPGISPDDLARYIMIVSEGLAVHAAAGSTVEDLARVVDIALRALPEETSRRPRRPESG